MLYSYVCVKGNCLYEWKQAGKSCYHEYGIVKSEKVISKVIPVVTKSRNIVSTIEFVHDAKIKICHAENMNDLLKIINKYTEDIPFIYVDISESADNGKFPIFSLGTYWQYS